MRMWMVLPVLLCRQHLNGEHGELHKYRHVFVKQYHIDRRVSPVVQIEPANMKKRHDVLACEMKRRGGNHASPYMLPDLSYLTDSQRYATADLLYNLQDLWARCPRCQNRIRFVLDRVVIDSVSQNLLNADTRILDDAMEWLHQVGFYNENISKF